jgi:gamma-glutamylcyclotransferase (GGCT)/AIG2-like uncharacterized protein YtfP
MSMGARGESIAFYGTLMRDQGVQEKLNAAVKLRHLGACSIPGLLYDLGDYPGLKKGDGSVLGELYQILDPSVVPPLDEYEEFNEAESSRSLFLRQRVRLKKPLVDCWVYFFNHSVRGRRPIKHGDWIRHIRNKRKRQRNSGV